MKHIGDSKKGESMKIKAIKTYRDKHENKLIAAGEVYDTASERAKLIVSKGFAIYQEEKVEEVEEESTQTPKKRRK